MKHYFPHFTDEEAEALRDFVTNPDRQLLVCEIFESLLPGSR